MKTTITQSVLRLSHEVEGNIVSAQAAISPQTAGLRMFDEPLVGFGDAHDPLFGEFKEPGVIGPWHLSPDEWLPGAQTVISMFFPFTEEVKAANRAVCGDVSSAWLHGRIEGQAYIEAFLAALRGWFTEQNIACVAPILDKRFYQMRFGAGIPGVPKQDPHVFGSTWSDRHAAFVCGLGTFGLSRGLITRRGMAGRFASVIVAAAVDADVRPYTDIYEYCIRCGACAKRCPGNAITLEEGKDHGRCSDWVGANSRKYAPRYGCGLCQTGVPCENGIPQKK